MLSFFPVEMIARIKEEEPFVDEDIIHILEYTVGVALVGMQESGVTIPEFVMALGAMMPVAKQLHLNRLFTDYSIRTKEMMDAVESISKKKKEGT